MCTMSLNPQFNGVELYFSGKPQASIMDGLKAVGYRWHNLKKCWYAKQNSQTMELAKMLASEEAEQEQPEQVKAIPAVLPMITPKQEQSAYYPPYDSVGGSKIFRDSSAVSIFDERSGYFADINAYIEIFSGSLYITDLTEALNTGKECKGISINFPWEISKNGTGETLCHIGNTGSRTFKEVYTRFFINSDNGGGERYPRNVKGIEVFTPFKRIQPIKTPEKWTLAHVWKAILSGQIYTGTVSGHYTDDYAYDAAVNFGTGRGIDLIKFAEKLIDSKSGWRVNAGKADDGIIPLSVCCHSFDCNTLYYDESCTLEEGKRRREQAQTDKENRNAAMLAKVITIDPEQYSTADIYSVQHLVMDDNTGEYSARTEQLQWYDIFGTDTIWEGDNEREETKCRLKVLSIATVAIDPHGMYCISNTFDRYNGDDERIIKSGCYMAYVTGYALAEILKEGKSVPMVRDNPIPFQTLEKELRMHFQTIHENGFACSRHTLFGVGDPDNFRDEHAKLMKEWNRIPR